jgi:serine/threonine-protein kinase SRPK3
VTDALPACDSQIATSNPDYGDTALHELEIHKSLTRDPSLTGFVFVRAAIDDFVAIGPTGAAHLCLVFEAMREPLSQFQHRLIGDIILPELLKVYVDFILQGLDYLHSECQIIHTGLLYATQIHWIDKTKFFFRS